MTVEEPVVGDQAVETPATAPGGVELSDGERFLGELPGRGGRRFTLTSERVIYAGRSGDDDGWAFVFVRDVMGVRIATQRKETRSLIWGLVGLAAALGVWRVATNETVGMVGGIVVGAISLILLGEYFLRPPDLRLEMLSGSVSLGGPIGRRSAGAAREFARAVLDARAVAQAGAAAVAPPPLPRYPSA